jgi:adenine-specific DNA-methyltransferase
VRKAGGVYYTPAYIVNYIVQNTVGKQIEGKSPAELAGGKSAPPFRVLDMACGSGSFLLGAYQCLLEHCLSWYQVNPSPKHAKAVYQNAKGETCLSIAERKRILITHIYGVDIDRQAVEVTKLSLLLKALEGENDATLSQQMTFFHERALPNLSQNIKCGNSLIASDFSMIPEDLIRVHAFDWPVQFPEAMKAGGFDAVIGNPPYLGGREWKKENGREYDYFVGTYTVAEYQFDIYALFLERGTGLLKQDGRLGFITPNTWLNNQSNTKLRRFILDNTSIRIIADYSRTKVFPDAVVLPIVTILEKQKVPSGIVRIVNPDERESESCLEIPQRSWAEDELSIFNINLSERDVLLRRKIEQGTQRLDAMANVKFGIKLYETGKGTPPQKPSDATNHVFESKEKLTSQYRCYLEGKDVNRYEILWKTRWLKYGSNLAAPRDPRLFEGQRLLVRRIVGVRLIATFVDDDYVTSQLLQIVKLREEKLSRYILGLLNSSLLAYYFRIKYNRRDKTFPEIRIYELASFPIRLLDSSKPSDCARHDRMVTLVDKMLALTPKLRGATSESEEAALRNAVTTTDAEIDRLVYELYGLTEEEIKIVEGES